MCCAGCSRVSIRIREYLFLVTVGWCLGVAALARALGLSYEIGAFIAGVAIAAGPIALYIAESLRPLRDFFLVLFFFALGASFNLPVLQQVLLPALLLSVLLLVAKPLVFKVLLVWQGSRRPPPGRSACAWGRSVSSRCSSPSWRRRPVLSKNGRPT